MKKINLILLVVFFLMSPRMSFAKETAKSPDKKKDVTYSCAETRKTISCNLTLNNAGKKTTLLNMEFPSAAVYGVSQVGHFCKSIWAPDSKKVVYYCYWETNIPETEIFPDINAYLVVYDLATNKKTELIKGGKKLDWFLGAVETSKTCIKDNSISWGASSQGVFLKFDGKKVTYHLMHLSWEDDGSYGNKVCQQQKCPEPKDMNMCSGPINMYISMITQDTNAKILSKKEVCYWYEVCD